MIQIVALLEVFPIILPVVQMEEFDRQELEIGDKSIPSPVVHRDFYEARD
jgi:hypothetical protein